MSLISLQYCGGFCHTFTWISHRCTCVPHSDPPHSIPQGHPSAPALSILYHALNLDWWFVSHMILYMFQCHSPKSSHPRPLPQSPKDCSIHLCLFWCLVYRGNSILFSIVATLVYIPNKSVWNFLFPLLFIIYSVTPIYHITIFLIFWKLYNFKI